MAVLEAQCNWPTWQMVEESICHDVNKNVTGLMVFQQLCSFGQSLFVGGGDENAHQQPVQTLLRRLELLISLSWEHLNTGLFKDVPFSWRYVYAYASLFKAKGLILLENDVIGALKAVDMAILMGAPILDDYMPLLARVLHTHCNRNDEYPSEIIKEDPNDDSNIPKLPEIVARKQRPLEKIKDLSVTEFMLTHFENKTPCVIEGLAKNWPAFSKWRDLSYFRKKCGLRTVPIETGSRYTASDWGQRLVTFSHFLDEYIITDKPQNIKALGYLAQHPLLDHIPELREDIAIPDFCFVGENDDDDAESRVEINSWFGPKTVSPLHQDPKDNILVQVVGRKYLHLFDPAETVCMYPFSTEQLLSNTSQMEFLDVDLTKYPKLAEANSGQYVILEPGDALYIPPKWWHFVSSLSKWSCSLSCWF